MLDCSPRQKRYEEVLIGESVPIPQVFERAFAMSAIGFVSIAPPGKLTVMKGATVRMAVSFSYRGTAISCTLRCSIGKRTLGIFDEIAYAIKALSLPQSADFVAYTAFADISTAPIAVGTDYDIEAKISEYAGTTLVKIDNVIDVIGAPEFSGFAITDYSAV